MSLKEDEIQQLELLAMLREHGKLTEEQFQLQTGAILRSSTIRKAVDNPLIDRVFKKRPKRANKPRIPLPQKEVVLERYFLPDPVVQGPIEKEQNAEPAVLTPSEQQKYAARRRKPSLSTLVSMRTEQTHKHSSPIVTLLTVSAAVLLTSLLATSSPLERMIGTIETVTEPAIALQSPTTTSLEPTFVEPLFGPLAERRCSSICGGRSAENQQACLYSCQRFSLAEYGRRITLSPLDPQAEANEMIYSCESKPLGARKALTRTEWKEQASAQRMLFEKAQLQKLSKDFGSTRLRFDKSFSFSNHFAAPPEASAAEIAASDALIRASCIRAHLSLAELGISIAHENSDGYSARFYQKMYQVLKISSLQTEAKSLQLSTTLLE